MPFNMNDVRILTSDHHGKTHGVVVPLEFIKCVVTVVDDPQEGGIGRGYDDSVTQALRGFCAQRHIVMPQRGERIQNHSVQININSCKEKQKFDFLILYFFLCLVCCQMTNPSNFCLTFHSWLPVLEAFPLTANGENRFKSGDISFVFGNPNSMVKNARRRLSVHHQNIVHNLFDVEPPSPCWFNIVPEEYLLWFDELANAQETDDIVEAECWPLGVVEPHEVHYVWNLQFRVILLLL